jgi:energy-coupling factor transporter ATP-binding protein EcfA2
MEEPLGVSDGARDLAPDTPQLSTPNSRKPVHHLLGDAECVLGNDGHAYALVKQGQCTFALRSGTKLLNAYLRERAHADNQPPLKRADLTEIDYLIQSAAEGCRQRRDVWLRVARVDGGIEIDVGDDSLTRIRVTPEGVQEFASSPTLFTRTPHMKALVRPAAEGDLSLLHPLLPQLEVHRLMLLAWITYVIANPKTDQAKYVMLVLTGGQGSGKSMLSKLLQRLIDPNVVGVQVLPSGVKEIAIATRNAHLVLFDNVRGFPHYIADALCIAATGGTITARQLYTDADQQVVQLHGAIVFNGLHHFIDQPDLAQRCLHINLARLEEKNRRSEQDMEAELARNLPAIMRGLYELIAQVLRALPTAKVSAPHRMYDFARWLAAMETVVNRPMLQDFFVRSQAEGQREALQENLLSAAVLEFAESLRSRWEGTSTDLLAELSARATPEIRRSREWPLNPISLSRRLIPMQAALREQGISLESSRGKARVIRIEYEGNY